MNIDIDRVFEYRHGVSLDLYSIEDIVSWAEVFFENNSIPDEWMIQLAIAQNSLDVTEALDPILSDIPAEVVWTKLKKILCDAVESKKIGSYQALTYAADYAPEEERSEDIFYLLLSFDDLQEGYGSIEEIDAEVLLYLKK